MSFERPQKRRRTGSDSNDRSTTNGAFSKPSASFKPTKGGRKHTVSVALPGSVVANAQTHDLKTNLIGTLARALAVFCIDEVIIFNDGCSDQYSKPQSAEHAAADAASGYTAFSDPNQFMFHILSYLECPPYLRQSLFGHHPNLRSASALPSLDIPSHARRNEWCVYREAVTVEPPSWGSKGRKTFVNAGLGTEVPLHPTPAEPIPPNSRVTVKFGAEEPISYKDVTAEAVAPDEPRDEGGFYWGYTPRIAAGLTEVFTECLSEEGYDFSIGMSERGTPLSELVARAVSGAGSEDGDEEGEGPNPGAWKHLLIVFGGPAGLEVAAKNDTTLAAKGVSDVSELFDAWINFMDGQGSRTIRTEEALWAGLMGCWPMFKGREQLLDE